jgi:hypothetical protein
MTAYTGQTRMMLGQRDSQSQRGCDTAWIRTSCLYWRLQHCDAVPQTAAPLGSPEDSFHTDCWHLAEGVGNANRPISCLDVNRRWLEIRPAPEFQLPVWCNWVRFCHVLTFISFVLSLFSMVRAWVGVGSLCVFFYVGVLRIILRYPGFHFWVVGVCFHVSVCWYTVLFRFCSFHVYCFVVFSSCL